MVISSPQPSVIHLVTLFRQITQGDIRIPAFQREFVWKEKQMIELLDSVAEGFPIGSILLWAVDKKTLRIAPSEETSFPSVSESFPTNYVLDGMQRLSTLYGVFHFGISTSDPRFDVVYDLESGTFAHRGDQGELLAHSAIPLVALFIPRQMLEHQARLSALPAGEVLIEKLLKLQAAFQEYMVPVVTIRSPDIHRIVGIFEKVNSTGTRLDPVDFMRAFTWAEDFDLNHFLETTAAELSGLGLELKEETIIKCVGLTLGIPPTTEGLLQLRTQRPHDLTQAFSRTIACMRQVSDFLRERFKIRSSNFIPYEGQLLLLFKTIGMEEANAEEQDLVVQWYWATGFNESLRGKPDHYVVRALENWRGLIRGEIRGLEPRLKLSDFDLMQRRLVSGGALSTTFAAMHAANGACSIVTGAVINPVIYMESPNLGLFQPIFGRSELEEQGTMFTTSPRFFANVLLLDEPDRNVRPRECIQAAAAQERWGVLRTQFIDERCARYLAENAPLEFLECRAELMIGKAAALVGTDGR